MSDQNNTKKVVVKGDAVGDLFPTPTSTKVEIEYQDKILEFEIAPMDNDTFANIGDKIKINNVDLETAKNSMGGMKIIADLYYPAIKVVLPKCCISPKFVDGPAIEKGTMSIQTAPLEIQIQLIDHIFKNSGVSKESLTDRKK